MSSQPAANCCGVCKKPSKSTCSACRNVFYCSKNHQKEDWNQHKRHCKPFYIARNDAIGRFLQANRPIKKGEVILKELPLIHGPATYTIPVCVGCGQGLTQSKSRPCTKCGWPVCSTLCEQNPNHLPECRFTCERGAKITIKDFEMIHPVYRCVTILRCLYHKKLQTKIWRKLEGLESHCDERKCTSRYEDERVSVAEFIRRFFKLSSIFSPEEILKICGIVQINSHEVPLVEPAQIAIYNMASLLEHQCTPNCSKSFTSQGQIIITAACDILQDEHLSISYADSLWGTRNRRNFLKDTKMFDCFCARCLDPTEFGTYFGAVKCQACHSYAIPKNFTKSSTTSHWSCVTCSKIIKDDLVENILGRIEEDLENVSKDDVEGLRGFLESCNCDYLHDGHFISVEIRLNIVQALGKYHGLNELTDDALDLKLKLCEDLVPLVGKLAFAEVRTLGVLLFEMHAGLVEKSRRLGGDKTLLIESRKVLQEAIQLLKNEPESLPEGKIHNQAVKNRQDLDSMLSNH